MGGLEGADLAILTHQLTLLGLQHVVVGNELRLEGCKRITCLPSILTVRTNTPQEKRRRTLHHLCSGCCVAEQGWEVGGYVREVCPRPSLHACVGMHGHQHHIGIRKCECMISSIISACIKVSRCSAVTMFARISRSAGRWSAAQSQCKG